MTAIDMTSDLTQRTVQKLSAAILAGGASRRMGTDKALLTLAGRTLLERAIAGVEEVAAETFVVGDRTTYHRFGVPVVADGFPDAGPLGGIATALRSAAHDDVLIVACDMPFLSRPLLRAMADLPREYDVLVPLTHRSGSGRGGSTTYETLHAIYRRTALPEIEYQIARGELSVVAALAGLAVRELPESWLRQYDPELVAFTNANRPDEWQAAQALLRDESVAVEDQE